MCVSSSEQNSKTIFRQRVWISNVVRGTMDDTTKCLLRRLVRRIPTQILKTTLEKWGRLTAAQEQSIDSTSSKWALTEKLLSICEENRWTLKHITELEMIYIIDNPNQGMWHAFQLMEPEDDAHSVELMQFKEQFKSHLSELARHVSVKIKKHTDEAVWIRIAWGDGFSRPNNLKPTYVVHYLQTPYVFVTRLTSKQKPLLSQALVLATRHHAIKDANLSGRKLVAIRDLLMRQYQQVFPSKFPSNLEEDQQTVLNPHIETEQAESAANRRQRACEAFGAGTLPQLQSVVYKLETKFKDHTNKTMTEREEPFRCVVKFASTSLLESLRDCACSDPLFLGPEPVPGEDPIMFRRHTRHFKRIASTPVTPLLSSIPLKGRNYFVITDNGPGPSSQTRQPHN